MLPVPPDPQIFRAYDIRGIAGKQIDAPLSERIGFAVGEQLAQAGDSAVAVGSDCRLSSPEISAALHRGLLASGISVLDLGSVPSPLTYFAASTLTETGSAISVTASHNPPEYNGFKIVSSGQPFGEAEFAGLKDRLRSPGQPAANPGRLHQKEILPDYILDVCNRVRLERPLKVVVDAGNSVCGLIAPPLYRRMGCKVTELFCEPDGRFPNHHPDPARAENTLQLQKCVQEQGADLGLAFDGDGDRLGVITETGDYVSADRFVLLLVEEILGRRPGATVVFDVKCSSLLPRQILSCGGRPLMRPSGHSLIKQTMARENACLGVEMSGHVFFSDRWYGFDDALYAGARLMEILAGQPGPLSGLLEKFPPGHCTPELDIEVAETEKFDIMKKVLDSHHLLEGKPDFTDGLRVEYDDGWGLIRASNTSPRLTMRFEADDSASLQRILSKFRHQLPRMDPRLRLPEWKAE